MDALWQAVSFREAGLTEAKKVRITFHAPVHWKLLPGQ